MSRKPKVITPRIDKALCKALCRELGYKRVAIETLNCVSSIYSRIGGGGLSLKTVRYLFLKYPNLLTWTDFKVTKLEDLEQFIVDKKGYQKILKICSLGRYDEYEEA